MQDLAYADLERAFDGPIPPQAINFLKLPRAKQLQQRIERAKGCITLYEAKLAMWKAARPGDHIGHMIVTAENIATSIIVQESCLYWSERNYQESLDELRALTNALCAERVANDGCRADELLDALNAVEIA